MISLLPSHRDHEWMVVSEEVNTDFVSLLSAVLESHVSQKIAGLVLKYYSSNVDLIFFIFASSSQNPSTRHIIFLQLKLLLLLSAQLFS